MSEVNDNDSDLLIIKKARAAKSNGDYKTALSLFNEVEDDAYSNLIVDEKIKSLRELSISIHLIDKFINDMGWNSEEYGGFDKELMDSKKIDNELDSIIDSVKNNFKKNKYRIIVDADRCIFNEVNLTASPPFNSSLSEYIKGIFSLYKENDIQKATYILMSVTKMNRLCFSAYEILTKIFYYQRNAELAKECNDHSISYCDDIFSEYLTASLNAKIIYNKDKKNVVYYDDAFYLIPESDDVALPVVSFHVDEGSATLYRHKRFIRSIRRLIIASVPQFILLKIRKIIYSTRLKYLLLHPVPLQDYPSSKSLEKIMKCFS